MESQPPFLFTPFQFATILFLFICVNNYITKPPILKIYNVYTYIPTPKHSSYQLGCIPTYQCSSTFTYYLHSRGPIGVFNSMPNNRSCEPKERRGESFGFREAQVVVMQQVKKSQRQCEITQLMENNLWVILNCEDKGKWPKSKENLTKL